MSESQQLRGLTDQFGRTVDYVRVSVTDRCNLRCTYCMSEQMQFLPKAELLTLEELDRMCTAFVRRGAQLIICFIPRVRMHCRATRVRHDYRFARRSDSIGRSCGIRMAHIDCNP